MFGAPSSTPGGDRDMRPGVFCRKFICEQLLFEAFFDIIRFLQSSAQNDRLLAILNPCKNYSNSLRDHQDTLLSHAGLPTFETLSLNSNCSRNNILKTLTL